MKVLYNWLKEFVDITAPAAELRSRLSMAGVAVDSVDETAAGPVLDAEITINRPDLLGHLGIAREIAALYKLDLKRVQPKLKEAAEQASRAARVEIECSELCARYTARIIRGVKIQPSPDWLRQRLEALGQSSINNVVDITNYVMLELGQPLHAFDYDRLAEHRIVVRRARPGETMRTLDGIDRKLTKDMCLICDARSPEAIGGVMGGAESEISFSTKDLLLESAWFDPISIRRTSKTLALRTEASMRFERGVDIELADVASRRAAELIQQLAGGEVLAGVVDVYPHPAAPEKIELSRKELLRIRSEAKCSPVSSMCIRIPLRRKKSNCRAKNCCASWARTFPIAPSRKSCPRWVFRPNVSTRIAAAPDRSSPRGNAPCRRGAAT